MPDAPPLTPLLEQYEAVKAQYPGHLVLFRVGDFYETFGDDARLLSRELDVVLTARSADARGERTPMAGVPHHAVDGYLARLVKKGYKVAVCDQVEDAAVAKGLVRRAVTRVVTPGTVIEERILAGPEHNFLATLVVVGSRPTGFAVVDVTTGELFHGVATTSGALGGLLALAPFAPREILIAAAPGEYPLVEKALHSEYPSARLDAAPPGLAAGSLSPELRQAISTRPAEEIDAVHRVLAYVSAAEPRLLPYIESAAGGPTVTTMRLDGKTLRHLEITRPMNPDDTTGRTLLDTWDATVTAPGRRTFAFWLRHPLADVRAIQERLSTVEELCALGPALDEMRTTLHRISDLSRIASRLAGRRLRPSELDALRESLRAVESLRTQSSGWSLGPAARGRLDGIDPLTALRARLESSLPDPLPPAGELRGLFRVGIDAEVDRLRNEEQTGLDEMEALERREAAATGIRTLKIGYNQVFGYYFEVTRPHLSKVPERFRRKQTLSGAERFTTEELAGIEARVLHARESGASAESGLWERFLVSLEPSIPSLHRLARRIGEIDTLASFAHLARTGSLVRPFVDDGPGLLIRGGRHPVLASTLGEKFVPNDTDLDREQARLLVLTGPNMAGKSTYMRQVGLIVLLAQVGSFVPAQHATIGVVSSLHTRMGFTDEIGRGKSSFMVEMTEVAEILRTADARSLVLLDEVGRGTSTFDGLAIAWASLRDLHDRIGCRTMVATHYHQLTELVDRLSSAKNAHFAVREEAGEVVFLHRLVPGSTDRSYGLHVARIAGIPSSVVREAESTLKRLESSGLNLTPDTDGRRPASVRYTQAILLPDAASGPEVDLARELRALDLDRMTPMDAHAWVAKWRGQLGASLGLAKEAE
jgi:DNA mismatch repair protein MutS